MPIFKNFSGQYFDIPADALEQYAISSDDARERLKTASVEGGQVHPDDLDEVEGQSQSRMHQRTL